jgi:transposase
VKPFLFAASAFLPLSHPFLMADLSRYYSTDYKLRVVRHYINHLPNTSYSAVATLFGIRGGHKTVQRWHHQYDGSSSSLESKPRSGRPPLLSTTIINKHIRDPITNANRESQPINYIQIHSQLAARTQKVVSIQTVRRYGHNRLGIKMKRTIIRTPRERK